MAKPSSFCGTGDLDARSFFATGPEDLKRNQFGAALGGPIRKDRVWFHGFYEGLRQLEAFSTAGYSPTADMFQGNFAGTGHLIYNPASFDPASGTRQPFRRQCDSLEPDQPGGAESAAILPAGFEPLEHSEQHPRESTKYGERRSGRGDEWTWRLHADTNCSRQIFRREYAIGSARIVPVQRALVPERVNPRDAAGSVDGESSGGEHFQARLSAQLRDGRQRGARCWRDPRRPIGITNTFEQSGVTAINLQGYSPFGRANGEVGNHDNVWQLDEEFTYMQGPASFRIRG